MRWLIILVTSLFLISSCGQSDTTLQDTHGHSIKLSQLKGKWVVVNYWAVWCRTCAEEMPEFNRFYHHNQDPNVVIYGASYDPLALPELQQAAKHMGIEFPVLVNDLQPLWHFETIAVVPTTFIINPDGKVVETISGDTSEDALNSILRVLKKG